MDGFRTGSVLAAPRIGLTRMEQLPMLLAHEPHAAQTSKIA
ncbi:MAG: hypothetical protein AVDCRST_MAG93-3172 [uncultured Chloroflexia bacterium]|uniref:Uncharacterized protein n=1 Tax=uncultured Chloroflexia bacterium TaxID=1672391 RepID=A0A6J4JJU2_9CHLR|nr:MAG: hypothetical protein AVDCRST_MAG93-3172 [uncultured Chloroflexia bacterium]